MTAPALERRVRPGEERELDLVVSEKLVVADGVIEVRLRNADGAPLPRWQPGAHVDLKVGDCGWRQYSLCGDLHDRSTWRLAILREPDGRGGSRWVHDNLEVGTQLRAIGPRNRFVLEPAHRYLFLAGGIGITPLLPMVAAAEQTGADWRMVYGGRRRESMAFAAELSARYGERVEIRPENEFGLLDLEGLLSEPDGSTFVYCCGPDALLTAVLEQGRIRGWDDGDIRVERFAAVEADAASDQDFVVELASTGQTVTVGAGESILVALRRAGIDPPYSCEEGICGTCVTRVLAGSVEHRDAVLDDHERASLMALCVSRSTGRLVLDL
ncbi:PDR/VanB family oxidoreductase [Kribbella sp. NPDC051620]|uniref:PDR/VanB family oxidoreductase n=1 Tax=Kribbella sp. NPDC051620 TaxID=3364120 RepID=UPI0037A6753D